MNEIGTDQPQLQVKCETCSCPRPATGLHSWGVYPNGHHNCKVPLCDSCVDALWQRIKGSVSVGAAHYEVEPIDGKESFDGNSVTRYQGLVNCPDCLKLIEELKSGITVGPLQPGKP